jgi:FKBP-type peptidyl-prolyl cis-trans isomerase SlyD
MVRVLAVLVVLTLSVPMTAAAQTPSPAPAAPAPAQAPSTQAPPAPAATLAIENGSMVQLEYTLSDDAGKVIDSNRGQPPLTYTQGDRQLMAALENQLVGLRAGQEKKVVLKPDEAFGPIDPSAQTEVPKEVLPPESLVVGAHLMARTATGEERPVMVKEIKDKTVVVDLNHPLAGKTLVFEIKVLGIEPPSKGGDSKAPESKTPDPKAAEPKAAEPKAEDPKPTK